MTSGRAIAPPQGAGSSFALPRPLRPLSLSPRQGELRLQLGWRRLQYSKDDATSHAALAETSPELAELSAASTDALVGTVVSASDEGAVPGDEHSAELDAKAQLEEQQRRQAREEAQVGAGFGWLLASKPREAAPISP